MEKCNLPLTPLFIPSSLSTKLSGAFSQNKSTSVSADFPSIPKYTTLYISYYLYTPKLRPPFLHNLYMCVFILTGIGPILLAQEAWLEKHNSYENSLLFKEYLVAY